MIKKPPEEEGFSVDAPTLVRMVSGSGRMIGAVLGHQYKIVEPIGEGGIGVVYRARQLTVDRDVAVKVLKKQYANDELAVRRFENEAQAIGKLRHPNTLRLYDCQRTSDGELYIVTELLSGSPLGDVLRDLGKIPIERAVRTFDEICRSLAEAHAAGIVHRDLKPANVFLDRIGNEDVVKVLDFGIAKILQGSGGITRAGAVPGTPQYMSPEQATSGKIDHRADIYSLGVILYQMIAGKCPFEGPSVMEILSKHITEKPPKFAVSAPGVEVSPELERLTMWMLEKLPEDRPQTVEEIRRYLPSILAQVSPVSPLVVPRTETMIAPQHAPNPFPVTDTLPPSPSPVRDVLSEQLQPQPPSEHDVLQQASKKWRWFSVVTGSLGVIFGVIVGYANIPTAVLLPQPPDKPPPIEITPPPYTEPQQPKLAKIVTQPPGAKVIAADGTTVGTTPLDVELGGVSTYLVMREDGSNGKVTVSAEKDAGRTIDVVMSEPVQPHKIEPPPPPVPVKQRMDAKPNKRMDKKKKR